MFTEGKVSLSNLLPSEKLYCNVLICYESCHFPHLPNPEWKWCNVVHDFLVPRLCKVKPSERCCAVPNVLCWQDGGSFELFYIDR